MKPYAGIEWKHLSATDWTQTCVYVMGAFAKAEVACQLDVENKEGILAHIRIILSRKDVRFAGRHFPEFTNWIDKLRVAYPSLEETPEPLIPNDHYRDFMKLLEDENL